VIDYSPSDLMKFGPLTKML